MVLMLLVVSIFFGSVFGWKAWQARQSGLMMESMARPPITVSTTVAMSETWYPAISAVGTLRAAQGVDVTTQESGMITDLRFESGAIVQAGDVLARQYVADERAMLAALEADVRLAELNLARAKDLLDQNLSSQFDYDTRQTDRDRAVAEASNVRLRIEKKTIRAPFAGRIGIRKVNVGQYVEPGEPIVRLEALDRILVDFPVSQRSIGLVGVGQPLKIFVDAYPAETFHGTVTAIAPNVRSDTRDIRLEGLIENPDEQLLPGMFVGVEIQLPTREAVVTLPQSAISYSPYGDSVFVVAEARDERGETMLVAENRFVQTGAARGDQVAIVTGVEPGATVVTAGQLKLRDGARVVVDNSVLVSNQPSSLPENN